MPKIDTYFTQNHEEIKKEQDIDNSGILLNTINAASNSVLEPTKNLVLILLTLKMLNLIFLTV